MREPRGIRTRIAALALLLPFALAATAAADDAAKDAAAAAAGAASPAAGKPAEPEVPIIRGITGMILNITPETIAVRNLAKGSGGRSFITLSGGPDTPVTGVKQSYEALRKGDLVAVSYQGEPPRAIGIRVLPIGTLPDLATVAGRDPYIKHGRVFIGWIKQIDAETMVVRSPDGPQGSGRKGEVKTFARQKGTVVELMRSSWDELRKGDRVSVTFRKGEPRPADRVEVVLRGGEKPLPPGLATRLFDPAYDKSVKDVDGIGEWPPGKAWPASGEAARSEPQASEAQKSDPAR